MKNRMKVIASIFALAIWGVFSSCTGPDEDPDLVNPPLVSPTVGVRYLNLSGDGASRTFMMNSDGIIENIPFGQVSPQIPPPADSSYISIWKNGEVEYQQKAPVKYLVRNINYTFISIETRKGSKDSVYRATDSIVTFQTTMIPPRNETDAHLRFFNGVNDSTSYFIRSGCPNGKILLSSLGYGDIQLQAKTISSGNIPVSIIKHYKDNDMVVGVYNLDIKALGQYCILILPNVNKTAENIYLYNEKTAEIEPVAPAVEIFEKQAETRIINMSYSNLSVTTGMGEIVTQNLKPLTMSDYSLVAACESQSSDLLLFETEGKTDTSAVSFEVLEKYTYVQLDSASIAGHTQIQIPPAHLSYNLGERASVRVVNGLWSKGTVTLSMGMRNSSAGTNTGEYLARNLDFGDLSDMIAIPSGRAPMTLFAATQPAKLLYCAISQFEAGKSYVIIIHANQAGEPEIAVIEDTDVSKDVPFSKQGVFAQVVSVITGTEKVKLNLTGGGKNILVDYSLAPSNIMATIVPVGTLSLQSDNKTHSIEASANKRILVVITGNKQNLYVFDANTLPMPTGRDFYTRRFVNATSDVSTMYVREKAWEKDSDVGPKTYAQVPQYAVSPLSDVTLETKKSFFFYDAQNVKQELSYIADLIFSFGKAYTIIYAGNAKSGYSGTIIQEF